MTAKTETAAPAHSPASSAGAARPERRGVLAAADRKLSPLLGSAVPALAPTAGWLLWVALSLVAVHAAAALGFADPALAQGIGGGSSGNIEQAGTKFYDALQGWMMLICGIGFLIACAWWALAGSNQQRKQQGTSGMICAVLAFGAAALVPDIMAAVAEWTGAQGA